MRGLAVLLVVSYHLGHLRSGWVGVQMFFVLSGYLITNILVRDRNEYPAGPFFARFYWRRSLRIFPLYYGYVLAVACAHVIANGVAPDLPKLWPYIFFYGMDIARMQQIDQGSFWFRHLWSLAVEEQFYLFWPFVVFFASPRAVRRIVALALLAVPVLALAIQLASSANPVYVGRLIYVLPLAQFGSFAAGAAVAVFPLTWIHDARRWFAGSFALVVVLGAANLVVSDQPMPISTLGYPPHFHSNFQPAWGYSVLNLSAALLILSCVRDWSAFSWLRNGALRSIGRVSYGMYVIHIPVMVFYNRLPFGAAWYTGIALPLLRHSGYLAVVWILAKCSYHGFEKHFLAMKERIPAFGQSSPTIVTPVNT
jgi:peptidoglycan/LPS O-acetylase OafA/YrhL